MCVCVSVCLSASEVSVVETRYETRSKTKQFAKEQKGVSGVRHLLPLSPPAYLIVSSRPSHSIPNMTIS